MAANGPWFRVFPPEPRREVFSNEENYGVKNMPERNSRPTVYFNLLFTLQLMQKFILETNRYARQFISRNVLGDNSRVHMWIKRGKLTLSEFKGFLAIVLNMGLNKKPNIQQYWRTGKKSQDTPWFRRMMSRNRFQLILKFLHLVDNSKIANRNDPNYNPAAKFLPLMNYMNMRFKHFYTPDRSLSVDETLIATRARSVMTQYIPTKAAKFGIKFWMLVESATGYLYHALIYRGKDFDPTPGNDSHHGHVVKTLLEESKLRNKGYHLYCDNFFTSIDLAQHLNLEDTYLTGTLRQNRNMPRRIKEPNLNARETVYMRNGDVLTCAYLPPPKRNGKPSKVVRMITSYHNAKNDNTGKPKLIRYYNKLMGGRRYERYDG